MPRTFRTHTPLIEHPLLLARQFQTTAEAPPRFAKRARAMPASGRATRWGRVVGLAGYFEPPVEHTGYATRVAEGRSIGGGLVDGSCKQVGVGD
jgi:hypothetical protein